MKMCEECGHPARDHSTEFTGHFVEVKCRWECLCDKFIQIGKMLTF